jgi:hypothetical protein
VISVWVRTCFATRNARWKRRCKIGPAPPEVRALS